MTIPRSSSKAVIGCANASYKSETYQETEGEERNISSSKTYREMEMPAWVLPGLSLRHGIPVICVTGNTKLHVQVNLKDKFR